MLVTDYDGTLAHSNSLVSEYSKEILRELGDSGIVRVIATGRSAFSCRQVMDEDFPVDYVVFSSGIGVLEWKTVKMLYETHFLAEDVNIIEDYLVENNYDFMIQFPVPDNHLFYMHATGKENSDFYSRVNHYRKYRLNIPAPRPNTASQFIVIFSENLGQFESIKEDLKNYKVVRATSPLDNKSMWVEIFPKTVSKAVGVEYLANKLNINNNDIVVCGNDYNDFDMLNWANNAFVVSNAVPELLKKYQTIQSNTEDGVALLAGDLFLKS